MLELKTKTYRRKFNISPWLADKFKYPIIFYLAHKDDYRAFLITFVIVDFHRSEIIYIISFSPENFEKVKNHPDENIFRILTGYNPHCSLQINPEENFYTFIENSGFFFNVNYKKNILKAFTGKDLSCLEKDRLTLFGSTFYKDEENSDYFYLSAISKNTDGKLKLNFFRASLDLCKLEDIFNTQSFLSESAPHVTRKYKNYLINSEFEFRRYKNKWTGKIFFSAKEYMRFVYKDIYKEFCLKKKINFKMDNLRLKNEIRVWNVHLEPEFSDFCREKGSNFLEICEKNKKYAFSVLPGTITIIDIAKRILKSYETSVCTPAHFEFDFESSTIYTSSHNFIILDKLYFLGPAAIDKFVIRGGELEKIGTFSNDCAYRFTTHKIFKYKNKRYICSFGQPNRLYFIDAETMETLYYDDIETDLLSDKWDIRHFLNNKNLEPFVLKTIEVSSDGEILFLLSHNFIYFYSFPERKILHRIDYRDFELGDNISLHDYYNRTTHCDYLK